VLELKVHDGEREVVLKFEHSLLSLSKWESKYKKAFLTNAQKTPGELVDYFQMMLVTPEEATDLVLSLDPGQMEELANYINEVRSASSVPDEGKKQTNQEIVTSELIYYWLSALRISFQPTETWHLSRIMMLVQIAGYKQQPEKKRRPREVWTDWIQENERRKKLFKTEG
jgi:hypothetical protein